MKKYELKKLAIIEIQTKLKEDIEALQELRFKKVLQQIENPVKIRQLKREIAQLKTMVRQDELNKRQPQVG